MRKRKTPQARLWRPPHAGPKKQLLGKARFLQEGLETPLETNSYHFLSPISLPKAVIKVILAAFTPHF